MATNESHEQRRTLPTEGTYFTIFLVLAVLTLTELAVTYIPIIQTPLLLGLAIAKAWLVVQFYMHLRYDGRFLSWTFLIPVLVGAVITIFLQPLTTLPVPPIH